MQNTRRVLVAIPWLTDRAQPALERLRGAGFELAYNETGRTLREEELIDHLQNEVFATIASSEPYNERVLAAAPDFKVVARMGVGYDQVDVAAATRHGVAVAMAFGTNHEAVADHAFALIAALGCQLLPYHDKVMAGRWGGNIHASHWQSSVGIIGLGRIGRAVARRCKGFEMRVLAYDTVKDEAYARANGIAYVPLERLLAESDFVTVHTPHNAETDKIINRERLALMKRSAYLVNTSRGGTVDEAALIEALREGRIAGAGLDVFEIEPLPAGSPLRELRNVILSPHSAGSNTRSVADMLARCAESIIAIGEGRNPGDPYVLNPEVLRP
jgi:D-3-phosphoglycerate dehydrogenase / 2-oxoglutarate reductase